MKKIVHYTSGFAATAGGVESVLRNMLQSMQGEEEYTFAILTRFAHTDSECYRSFVQQGTKIYSFNIPHLTPVTLFAFRRKVRDFFAQHPVDVLHFHGTDEPFVIEEARRAGVKKIVVHIHTPSREHAGIYRYYDGLKNFLARRNLHLADTVLAVSRDSADTVAARLGVNGKEICVMNNCIHTKEFRFSQEIRDRYRREMDICGTVIGHVGRFADVKNHSFLLRVFAEYVKGDTQAVLLLVGDGELRNSVEKLAAELGLRDRVRFVGERMDIAQLLCAMDVFVLPSKFEGFPMVTLEAQSTGLPCVLSDAVPQKVVITDRVAYCSLNDDLSDWCAVIRSYTQMEQDRVAANHMVEESGYGFSALRKTLIELYQ